MKHLKKYNENNEEFDLGYIEDCFVEFKDNSEYDFEIEKSGNIINIYINILPEPLKIKKEQTLTEVIKYANSINNFYLDIENCIDKVKIKHTNITTILKEELLREVKQSRFICIRLNK
jgi:hypothetical protein